MPPKIDDLRIQWTKVVLPPVFLEEDLPITETATATIFNARTDISAILKGRDSRLLVLCGPCSIHDTAAAREYGALLKSAIKEFAADLRIVMRVYFEKPRTTIGWKGLINDPHLDQSYKINDGLRLARHLLLDLPGQRTAVRLADRDELGAPALGGSQRLEGVLGIRLVSVEEVLRVVDDAATARGEVANRVLDHAKVLVGVDPQDLAHVE